MFALAEGVLSEAGGDWRRLGESSANVFTAIEPSVGSLAALVRFQVYGSRSTVARSTRAARTAGLSVTRIVTARITPATLVSVTGSYGLI